MPSFAVATPQRTYSAVVERGVLERAFEFVPPHAGALFVLTTEDVWRFHGARLRLGRDPEVLFFPGGEERKRLATVEALAEEMAARGGDRSSVLAAFGGGIVGDVGGFLAAVFMRGIPVVQIPTTLLAQVDAGVGGKTGVNLTAGKNLVGAFHQPLAALIDPQVLDTLPEREYRAGLFEVLKCGIIRSASLFALLVERRQEVMARAPEVVERMIAESVRIKAEVVSADERESDLRRILNFGHTIGHALEAETGYARFLHGEAVGFGMRAAVFLAERAGCLPGAEAAQMRRAIEWYGPVPSLEGITAEALTARLKRDKKTVQGRVHFVLPERVGQVRVVTGLDDSVIRAAIEDALR